MKRWNKQDDSSMPTDKEILMNAGSWKSHIVEGAAARVIVEIMELIEANEIQKEAVGTPTGGPGKGKKS